MDICSDSSIWISGSKGVVLKAKTSHFTQLNNPLSFSQKLSSKESKIAHLSNSKLMMVVAGLGKKRITLLVAGALKKES
jgi:hypothetical protein